MKTSDHLTLMKEFGREPSEQWIQSVMERVRAEAEIMPFLRTGHTERFGGLVGIAAAAAVVIALFGWVTLPSDEELAWKAQTGGYVSEYLLLVRK